MNPRTSLIAAVVGALLAGGATTGSTRASLSDQAPMPASSVTAGAMGFTATSPGAVTVDRVSGSTADTTFVLDDTSVGRNLRQRLTAAVASTPPGVTATIGTACPGSASVRLDTTPTSAGQALCVRVASSSSAVSGSVTIGVSGAQQPAGWTAPTQTVTIPVTVNQPPVSGVTIRCGTEVADVGHSFEWAAAAGATGYSIYQSTSASGPFGSPIAVGSGLSHTAVLPDQNETYFYRVTALIGGVESLPSNVLKVRHNGVSHRFSCGAP